MFLKVVNLQLLRYKQTASREEPIIPEDDTDIQKNDIIVGLVKISSLKKLKKILRL